LHSVSGQDIFVKSKKLKFNRGSLEMKKILFLSLFILLSANVVSQTGGWSWVHPKPHGQYINYFKMFDANNWVALADYGVMTKTSNAGATWSTFSIGYQSTLYPGAGIYTNLTRMVFTQTNFLLGTLQENCQVNQRRYNI
jgi:hypothetical protein